MNFISLFVLVAISLQLFSDAFRPSSFGIQPHRRKYSTIISFDAAINTPPTVNTVFTSESTSAYGADEKKTKKRSSADQVDNIEQKRKQTEVWRFLKRDINMSDKQSKTIHQLYPWLFDIDYEQKIKPIVELLRSYDFHNKVIRLIIKENPFVFQKEISELQRRIDYLLEQTEYSNLQLIHLLEYQPIILSLKEEKIANIFSFFKEVVEFDVSQLQFFFKYQFRVWRTELADIKEYYGKLRALGFSPEQIQARFLSNKHVQKKFYFQLPRVETYDPRYLTEYLD